MSYILDALRRADAERERGSVPSLHAQSVLPGSPEQAARRGGKPLPWIVAALSLALAASLAWHFTSRDGGREPAPVVADAGTTVQAGPVPAPTPTASVQQQTAVLPPVPVARPAPATVPAAVPVAPTAAPPAATSPAVRNTAGPAAMATPPAPATMAPPSGTNAAAPANSVTATTSGAPATNNRLPTQDELPEDIRRQLPKFSVGGSIYSESAASRFLILNGQIFHENDKVMPELVLEQIKLKSAVLRYRNQRFTISY